MTDELEARVRELEEKMSKYHPPTEFIHSMQVATDGYRLNLRKYPPDGLVLASIEDGTDVLA